MRITTPLVKTAYDAHGRVLGYEIQTGGEPVTICKDFGPLIAYEVRVHLDREPCQWVVEKQVVADGSGVITWVEMARFNAQDDDEPETEAFHDDPPCQTALNPDGRCPSCGFAPDMQGISLRSTQP